MYLPVFSFMFIDKAQIFIKSGKGGDGCLSFHREKFKPYGGPDGGNGGRGGSVVMIADYNLTTLLDLRKNPHYTAKNGEQGSGNNCVGKSAGDLIIKVPIGTIVRREGSVIADLTKNNQTVILANGGRGGRGNASFKSSRNTAPRINEKGQPGEEWVAELELKLIADVGIIGYPNAGKSTLLSVISAAKPKVADYPFTTLVPNLGVVGFHGKSLVFADIPGLIEGAHQGKGLGGEFLRHIERTKLLIHLIDSCGYGQKDAYATFLAVNKELEQYSPQIAFKKQIIALNKIDLPDSVESLKSFKRHRKKVFPISAVTGKGIKELLAEVFKESARIKPVLIQDDVAKPVYYKYTPAFEVHKSEEGFVITGRKVTDLVEMTNFSEQESVDRLQKILKSIGIEKSLSDHGAVHGDIVKVGKYEFTYEKLSK